jgi:hypothetical protein
MGAFNQNRQDANVTSAAIALPAGASTTVNGASIDLNSTAGAFHETLEFELLSASATLGVTPLPNGETITYTFQESTDDITFTDVYVLSEALMTGAGGVGDTAKTARFRAPSDISRYVRVSAVTSGSAGDCSAATMQLKVMF